MLGDTILAVASPPGIGARGIIRVSGPDALAAARQVVTAPLKPIRGAVETSIRIEGGEVECLVVQMPGPGSYTGEDVVELHLPGAPLLLDLVCAGVADFARPATPGEFTRRAYENGRLDLAAAEAVQQLIHAADEDSRRFAMDVLQGGLAAAVDDVRDTVQDAMALLEVGLDFDEGETGAVDPGLWLPKVEAARARCLELRRGLPPAGVGGEVLLLGAANAGKSSLANALTGREDALVAPVAGTTRDVLVFDLGDGVRLLDGPGDLEAAESGLGQEGPAPVDRQALALRDQLATAAGAYIEVVDGVAPVAVRVPAGLTCVARVVTKADLSPRSVESGSGSPVDGVPRFVLSAVSGAGIEEFRAFLRRRLGGGPSGLASRLHGALSRAVEALERVLQGAQGAASGSPGAPGVGPLPDELLALELADACDALEQIHGRGSPEDLLDRIFAGFCLGK